MPSLSVDKTYACVSMPSGTAFSYTAVHTPMPSFSVDKTYACVPMPSATPFPYTAVHTPMPSFSVDKTYACVPMPSATAFPYTAVHTKNLFHNTSQAQQTTGRELFSYKYSVTTHAISANCRDEKVRKRVLLVKRRTHEAFNWRFCLHNPGKQGVKVACTTQGSKGLKWLVQSREARG